MPRLHVVVTSTRPGRVGLAVAQWFAEQAKAHGGFEVTLVDLLEVNLPMFNEPKHPRLRQYEHEHTKAWSRTVDSADAFVFALPEYNYAMPPAFVNAVDYLVSEWAYKPAALLSYGGISGGLRSAQMAKQLLTSVKVMPIPEAIPIAGVAGQIDNGRFKGGDAYEKAAKVVLDELLRWSNALKVLRMPAA